jgi:IclR family transcriptional regulator, acetate operon repressor
MDSNVGQYDGPGSGAGQDAAGPDQRYQVQSVGRALDIVAFVADGPEGGLPVADISRMLGISKSSTLATVRTLVAHGYLRPVKPGPRYRLGMSLIRLGDLTAHQFPVAEICTPVLREIAQQTRLTARAAVADEGFPLFVNRVDGPGTIRFHTPLGRREPAHATAAGKAILSTLAHADIRAMVGKAGLPSHTENTITSVDRLLRELDGTRERGYAVDDEEDVMGVVCVGAAFFNHAGSCAGALSVTGLKADMPAARVADLGVTMRGYADNISVLVGGRRYADLSLAHPDGNASG